MTLLKKFADLEIWIIAGLTALSMWKPVFMPVTILVAVFFFVLRRLVLGYFTRRSPSDWTVEFLLTALSVTTVILLSSSSISLKDPGAWLCSRAEDCLGFDLIQVLRLLTGIALFYAIINWAQTPGRLEILDTGVYLVGLGLSLLATISVQWAAGKIPLIPESVYQYFNILVSDQINPNVLAGSLVLMVPVSLASLAFNWSHTTRTRRLLAATATLVMLAVLLLSQSRSAWIAMTVSILVLIALRWRWGWLAGLAAVLSIAATMIWFRSSTLGFYILGGFQGVLNTRIDIWSRALFLLNNFSASGVGFGNYPEMVSIYYPFFEEGHSTIPHAHNLYMQIGLDLGLGGLVAWLAVWITIIVSSWRLFKQTDPSVNPFFRSLGAGYFASQVALGVNGLIDVLIWGMVRSAPLVWALWGIAVAGFVVGSGFKPMMFPVKGKKLKRKFQH